jgi:dihydroflavonol-4-reductase
MILVTGATGHIGNVLVRQLVQAGKDVCAMILPGEDTTSLHNTGIEMIEGDVLDSPSLKSAFEGVNTVYHLAGVISILPGKNQLVRRVNVEGTQNVLKAAIYSGVRRLVYTSSIHAIARAPHGTLIDESLPFDAANPYGEYDRSKAQASLEVLEAVRNGLDAVIVCPTGVIGPNDYRGSEMGQIIRGCLQHKAQWYVDGAYDFVDVRDVARGLIQAERYGRSGQTYILSGERLTIARLLDTIREITGDNFPRLKVPVSLARLAALFTPLFYRISRIPPRFTSYSLEVLASNANISHARAQRELGYSARPLYESIADTVSWFLANQRFCAARG